jgi:diguanylate cyclase (GGDEF)-like protein
MEEARRSGIGEKYRLIGRITVLLVAGFVGTSLFAFFAARDSIRASIERDSLPAAAEYVHAALQKELLQPLFVSSMMANDTFLHDWVERGETDVDAVITYLSEIRNRYGAFTTFFVSDATSRYYQADGVLKVVKPDEARDGWYYRVRSMPEPYELNLDPDMAHGDVMTVFINYRVLDRYGDFLGAAGVGLAIESMNGIVEDLRLKHDTAAYCVDASGRVLIGSPYGVEATPTVSDDAALSRAARAAIADGGGSYRYRRGRDERLLLVKYLPELKWYLFVERTPSAAMSGANRALWLNLAFFTLVIAAVISLTAITIDRYQSRLERTASYDSLTGALNRMAFAVLCDHAVRDSRRSGTALSVAMFDVDDFKRINDARGHLAGDRILRLIVDGGRSGLRQCDSLCRWGGEEFIVALTACAADGAIAAADKFRASASALCSAEAGMVVTISAGVATLRPDETFESLVGRADDALLAAKRGGKNRTIAAESRVSAP